MASKPEAPRLIAEALLGAQNLSHSRLTLVSPMDVSTAAVKYREAIVDLATLVGERSRVGPDAVWDEHIDKGFKKTHHAKVKFVLESSKDLNSGTFKGLGPFRSITMVLLRWRVRRLEKGLV